MVQMTLEDLSSRNIVEPDEERKAAMVSNLLVVLCADKGTQPVVNTDRGVSSKEFAPAITARSWQM